ncbi:MAG: peptidase E [Deltaproteobacteria bacterium CG_4_10_14_0_2_um_filter_43_8]|nr:MAG: peptidase E [Deltaproteobacteria bacterium CG11_big_fil_rev_8_21_14_0_20_42_23]PJA18528.1 MAG: peptidase E [Deltaproteobacteria bacterium CG_4_10_14_0_2_um_filter_43_8]PJC63305.1 MAG: peptidase E [Deltaproteobacteria bacterium CG_4_9_14_0_2_um_filter_42_21]
MVREDNKQIIAMGGGSFGSQDANLLLERYVLKQCRKKNPRVCFIPTASGESPEYILQFYDVFHHLNTKPSHLSFFKPPSADLRGFLLDHDIIYVGGGNTKSMLALWREWGVDKMLREAWNEGVVLCGVSAGAICWFAEGVTDSIPGKLTKLKCLGFLRGSNCPHYDGEVNRRPAYHQLLKAGKISKGIACDDGAALHYIGTQLHQAISCKPNAKAYQLKTAGSEVREQAMATHYLGK